MAILTGFPSANRITIFSPTFTFEPAYYRTIEEAYAGNEWDWEVPIYPSELESEPIDWAKEGF